jgi:hypothetical protein
MRLPLGHYRDPSAVCPYLANRLHLSFGVTRQLRSVNWSNSGATMSYDPERAADLVLALMQLTLHEGARAWKSYDWDVMNDLFERGFISNPRSKAKSVVLSDEGMARSRAMFARYLEAASRTSARDPRDRVPPTAGVERQAAPSSA